MPAKFWDNQNLIILEKLCNFKKKHLELLNSFLSWNNSLKGTYSYKDSKILKLLSLTKCTIIKDFYCEKHSQPLINILNNLKINNQHQHATRSYTQLFFPKVHTRTYQKNSIKYQSTKLWNNHQQILQIDLLQQTKGELQKNLISEHFLNNY